MFMEINLVREKHLSCCHKKISVLFANTNNKYYNGAIILNRLVVC